MNAQPKPYRCKLDEREIVGRELVVTCGKAPTPVAGLNIACSLNGKGVSVAVRSNAEV